MMETVKKSKCVVGTVILILLSAAVIGCNPPALNNAAPADAVARDVKSIHPDLTARVYYNVMTVVINQPVLLWARVKNEGTALTLNTKLSFQIGGSVSIIDVPMLDPGEEFITPQTSVRFDHAGTFLTTATADYDFQCHESDETNNTQQVPIYVKDYGQPDLYISSITFTGTPKVGQVLHVTVTVKNNIQCGLAPATKLQVRFGGEITGTYHDIPERGLNQSWNITRDWPLTDAGNFGIRAIADVYDDAAEKNEGNNTRVLAFTVIE
jgi:subtilase family serine protease